MGDGTPTVGSSQRTIVVRRQLAWQRHAYVIPVAGAIHRPAVLRWPSLGLGPFKDLAPHLTVPLSALHLQLSDRLHSTWPWLSLSSKQPP